MVSDISSRLSSDTSVCFFGQTDCCLCNLRLHITQHCCLLWSSLCDFPLGCTHMPRTLVTSLGVSGRSRSRVRSIGSIAVFKYESRSDTTVSSFFLCTRTPHNLKLSVFNDPTGTFHGEILSLSTSGPRTRLLMKSSSHFANRTSFQVHLLRNTKLLDLFVLFVRFLNPPTERH